MTPDVGSSNVVNARYQFILLYTVGWGRIEAAAEDINEAIDAAGGSDALAGDVAGTQQVGDHRVVGDGLRPSGVFAAMCSCIAGVVAEHAASKSVATAPARRCSR